jgi:hypothetical protein
MNLIFEFGIKIGCVGTVCDQTSSACTPIERNSDLLIKVIKIPEKNPNMNSNIKI